MLMAIRPLNADVFYPYMPNGRAPTRPPSSLPAFPPFGLLAPRGGGFLFLSYSFPYA